ncbi:hypothetical protein EV44_g3611 [Erysiphe necator]|uniref:Uncharacterized protein n=1 Tax=Uncinula necator TaxID=52586 RepID=A0A0B1P863_UNCNE|nr:hypothetical protein EV44_g3611 [Erysiphe necator]
MGDLEIELAASRLKNFLKPENCLPSLPKDNASDLHKLDVELEEYEFQHAQAFKMILQSVDINNKVAIQSCRKASDAYDTLKSRYEMKDTALLSQLLTQIFTVQSMKQSSVTDKYDLKINLTTQIAEQQPDAKIPDIVQVVILMRSLASEYDTTLEILTSKEKFPTVNEVF